LAVQPMMSPVVLENAMLHAGDDLRHQLRGSRLAALLSDARQTISEVTGRIAFLLRFGNAPPPSGRTGRLPVDNVIEWV
jgi:hypothetical protein